MYLILLLWTIFLGSGPQVGEKSLSLSLPHTEAEAGATICVDLTAAGGFQEMIGLQYTIRWDPAVLHFQGVKGFGLRYLTQENFGAHRSGEGLLTFFWLDQSLKGVSLADNSRLFQLCFQVRGKPGRRSALQFSQEPTPFEAVNAAEQLLSFSPREGSVTVLK